MQRKTGKRAPLGEVTESSNVQNHGKAQFKPQIGQAQALEARVQQQNIQIQILSEELNSERREKEETRQQLNLQREKNKRSSSPIAYWQANGLTRRRPSKCEITADEKTREYEWQLAQMREEIRIKDEEIEGNRQRLQECARMQKGYGQIEKEIRCLRDLFIKSQQKQVNLQQQIQSLKTTIERLSQEIQQKQGELTVAEGHSQKLQTEHKSIVNEFYRQQEEIRTIQKDMKELMNRQNEQIRSLQKQLAGSEEKGIEFKMKEDLANVKREMKRILFTYLKDVVLRKKAEGELAVVLEGRLTGTCGTARQLTIAVEE